MGFSGFEEKVLSLHTDIRLSLILSNLDSLSLVSTQEGNSRRIDHVVEDRSAIDQHGKAENLQPLEGLPSKAQADNPDEERSASVDGASCCSRNLSSDTQTKEVEATVRPLACT